ncbi:MAG: glycosyltransferase [Geobacteraceae bacterium]|nr:glycosyltransferase [Geobacteraceae bacterium]
MFEKEKPLVTFVLFAYNQEQYIREAVEGAFAQTYSPLEIILSDDCSSDRTFEIMQEMVAAYQGPHKVILNRNLTNQGLISHVNSCMALSKGELVVFAAGDDISFPDRVAKMANIFDQHPEIFTVSMNYIIIDKNGEVVPNGDRSFNDGKYSLEDYMLRKSAPICGPTSAYRKKLFEIFGPLSPRCQAEDVTLFFRSLLLGATWHQSTYGAYYRIHGNNMTAGMNFGWAKRIYQQNKRDLKYAVNRGLLAGRDISKIEHVIRDRLVRGIVISKYKNSKFKMFCFFYTILFSKAFSINDKRSYYLDSLRQLIPNFVFSIYKK